MKNLSIKTPEQIMEKISLIEDAIDDMNKDCIETKNFSLSVKGLGIIILGGISLQCIIECSGGDLSSLPFFILAILVEIALVIPVIIFLSRRNSRRAKHIHYRELIAQALEKASTLIQSELTLNDLYDELDMVLKIKAAERSEKQRALVEAYTWVTTKS